MWRSFLLFSLIGLWVGCQSPTAPDPGKPSFSLSCAGIPNGGIVGVVVTPPVDTLWRFQNTPPGLPRADTLTAKVFRDDPNTPGIQFYCTDATVTVAWTAYETPPTHGLMVSTLTPLGKQKVIVTNGTVGIIEGVVGTASLKADTSIVHVLF